MTGIFAGVLNMSIGASMVIIIVCLLRRLLRRLPGVFSYGLWLAVLVRLFCPFSPEVSWGILPAVNVTGGAAEYTLWAKEGPERGDISEPGGKYTSGDGNGLEAETRSETGSETGAGDSSAQSRRRKSGLTWQSAAVLWLTGCILLFLCGVFSYVRLMRRLKEFQRSAVGPGEKETPAWLTDGTGPVTVSGKISAPFTAGFFRPVICLPADFPGLEKSQVEMVIEHEKFHIARKDHLVKLAACMAVCIHWFNPLVWLAFHLMEQDMEISCDEAVLKKMGYENRKSYARALLCLSQAATDRSECPVAFGEKGVKARIRRAVMGKRMKGWMVPAAVVLAAAAAVLLLVSSQGNLKPEEIPEVGQAYGSDSSSGTDEILTPAEEEKRQWAEEQETGGQETGDQETEDQEIQDSAAVLLRNPEGVHVLTELKYGCPLVYDRVSDNYGIRVHPFTGEKRFHSGVDFAAESGTPISAAAAGTVYETGMDADCGLYVILQHSNGDMTYYAHCSEIMAEEGETVEKGEQIAAVGSTGRSTGAHLHFALSREGRYVEPEFFDPSGQREEAVQ